MKGQAHHRLCQMNSRDLVKTSLILIGLSASHVSFFVVTSGAKNLAGLFLGELAMCDLDSDEM